MYGVISNYSLRNCKVIAVVPKTELSYTANSIGIISIAILLFCLILTVQTNKYSIYKLNELSCNFNIMTEKLKLMLSEATKLSNETIDSAAISMQNTAATEEVTATIQNQSEQNNLMNSLAKSLNQKAIALSDLVRKFKF